MATFDSNSANQINVSAFQCRFNHDSKYIFIPVSYTIVFIFGLALNATALYMIVFRTKRWKPYTVYMFNLTVCDTLYIFTLPFLIYYHASQSDWPFSELFCKLIRFLFNANLYGSILFLCCISLHRFIGICYPVHSLNWVSNRRARLVSVAVWVCVLSCQAPVLYFAETKARADDKRTCYATTSREHFHSFVEYISFVSVVMFFLPFLVVMVSYVLMVRKLLEPSQGSEGNKGTQRSKQKSVKMLIIVLAAFMLCFLPFHVTKLLFYVARRIQNSSPAQISCKLLDALRISHKVTETLASTNSCVDPILYFLAGQKVCSKLKRKSNTSASTPSNVSRFNT